MSGALEVRTRGNTPAIDAITGASVATPSGVTALGYSPSGVISQFTVPSASAGSALTIPAHNAPADVIASVHPAYRCDGSLDKTILTNAFVEGDIQLTQGDYYITSVWNIGAIVRKLIGPGSDVCRIHVPVAPEGTVPITWDAPRTEVGTISADANKGVSKVTCAADYSATLPPGTLIQIVSGDVFNGKRDKQTCGEYAVVRSWIGTTMTVSRQLRYSYTTANTIRIFKVVPLIGCKLKGFQLINNPANTARSDLMRISRWMNYVNEDVLVDGIDPQTDTNGARKGFIQHQCVNGVNRSMKARNVWDKVRGAQDAQGYPFFSSGCENVWFEDSYGYFNRHSFEWGIDQLNPEYNSVGVNLPNFNCGTMNCTAERDTSAGFSSHGHSDTIQSYNDTTIMCGGSHVHRGINTQGHNAKVRGINLQSPFLDDATFDSYEHVFYFGENVQQGGPWSSNTQGIAGTGLVWKNPDVDVTGSTRFAEGATTAIGRNIHLYWIQEPLVNAHLEIGKVTGHTGDGVNFTGDYITDTKICNGVLDMVSSFASRIPFNILPNATTGYIRALLFRDITVLKARNPVIQVRGANASGANAGAIDVQGVTNRANGGVAQTLLKLIGATFFRKVRMVGTDSPDTLKANIYDAGTATVTTLSKYDNTGSDGIDAAP